MPDTGTKQLQQSNSQINSSDDSQNDVPKPQTDVDFLIKNIHSQDTKNIMSLNSSRTTELVEQTFGHAGENAGHGVDAVFSFHVRKVNDLKNISESYILYSN